MRDRVSDCRDDLDYPQGDEMTTREHFQEARNLTPSKLYSRANGLIVKYVKLAKGGVIKDEAEKKLYRKKVDDLYMAASAYAGELDRRARRLEKRLHKSVRKAHLRTYPEERWLNE